MRLSFDSIDEVKDFVKSLKVPRKGGDVDEGATGQQTAPEPLKPPAGAGGFPGALPGPGAGAMGGAFPAAGATGMAPEVQALVTRITTKVDSAIAGGQPVEAVLQWFRGQCGPEAAAATMDQIKTVFLPRAALPVLENIAKLMAA